MSSQSSLYGEIREQHQKTKDMSLKGKLDYFWYYYKIHTFVVIAVIALAGTFIYQLVTSKDAAFYSILISSDTSIVDAQEWDAEFAEYAGIDTEEYNVIFDTSFVFTSNSFTDYTMSSMEKLVAMASAGMIDVVIADTATFEKLARSEFYTDLTAILPPETLEKFKDCLYYTDAADFDTGDIDTLQSLDELPNPDEYTIDHKDASSMDKPVLVGICLPEGSRIVDSGCYDYLKINNVTYQGYPSEAVLGIPATTEHLDTILQFLDFLMAG
ncbi:MAG: hypothetical protein NC341_05045 [Blautia sp.]|nr:hypothetical protein [Blautia sp.]MCM1199687.1 hypothetical protein [Bacteroides fragilis]